MLDYDVELLNSIYKEISEELGIDIALEFYKMFKGTQVTFPIRFFNPECLKNRIKAEYDGSNVKLLAKKYNYSEKTIRRILKENL